MTQIHKYCVQYTKINIEEVFDHSNKFIYHIIVHTNNLQHFHSANRLHGVKTERFDVILVEK